MQSLIKIEDTDIKLINITVTSKRKEKHIEI